MKAKTIKEIACVSLEVTIPTGTEFTILTEDNSHKYATCKGLPVTSVWFDEYVVEEGD